MTDVGPATDAGTNVYKVKCNRWVRSGNLVRYCLVAGSVYVSSTYNTRSWWMWRGFVWLDKWAHKTEVIGCGYWPYYSWNIIRLWQDRALVGGALMFFHHSLQLRLLTLAHYGIHISWSCLNASSSKTLVHATLPSNSCGLSTTARTDPESGDFFFRF